MLNKKKKPYFEKHLRTTASEKQWSGSGCELNLQKNVDHRCLTYLKYAPATINIK